MYTYNIYVFPSFSRSFSSRYDGKQGQERERKEKEVTGRTGQGWAGKEMTEKR
jgi:hypothetical protein